MVYYHGYGTVKRKLTITTLLVIAGLFTLVAVIGLIARTNASSGGYPNGSGSVGKVTFNTNIGAGINYGSGIPNGEWLVAENQGVQLGLRATDGKDGLLGNVAGANGNRVAVYTANTGYDQTDTNRAEWNYEWSVDLSKAQGRLADKTLADYSLYLEQDFTNQSLFGLLGSDPVSLPFVTGVCDELTTKLCQQSWNPKFGNTDFDFNDEGTYNLRLVLVPKTFNGAPLAVAIQVNVVEPNEE